LFPESTVLMVNDDCVSKNGEMWRWLSYQFTHLGVLHAVLNVFALLVCGISLEVFHGTLRMTVMFNFGVFAGACCYFLSSIHRKVVGMSGGCYALQGMHLSDLLINWEAHWAPKTKLCGLFGLVVLELVYSRYGATQEISHSAHIGGYIGGLLIGILVGRSFGSHRCERAVKAIAVLFACVAVCFCIGWSQIWPPRDIWDSERWCWARQVRNLSIFEDASWHCVRCGDHACIARWSRQQSLHSVDTQACDTQYGWARTER